jgi:hypothetical protein
VPIDGKKAVRTREEVEANIRAFSAADWARLHKLANSFKFDTKWDLEDLLQEAIVRTLQGTRNCPIDVTVIKHLIETMSSIADGEREKAHNQTPHVPISPASIDTTVEPTGQRADPPSLDWSAEERLVYESGKTEILTMFNDDSVARELVDGVLAGFDTEQLQELTGLRGTAYNTKRTLIRRRLLKLSPKRRFP